MLRAHSLRARSVRFGRFWAVALVSASLLSAAAFGGTAVTWDRQANGQTFSDPYTDAQGNFSDYTWTWPDNANWSQSQSLGTAPYSGRTITLAPSNWSQDIYPNGDFDVTIGGDQVTDDVSVNVDTLTLGGELDILGGAEFTITNGALVNNGTIVVNWDTANFGTSLNFSADTSISGNGKIVLNNDAGTAQLNAGTGATVTIGAGQTISGLGQINGNFINNGAIRATVAAGSIDIAGTMTNNNIINADDEGTVTFNGTMTNNGVIGVVGNDFLSNLVLTGTINNSSNGLVAVGGNLYMDSVAIDGGMVLASNAGAFIQVNGNSAITNAQFNLGGGNHLDILSGSTLTFGGSMNLINDGTISVNSDQNVFGTALNFDGDITVGGTGDILLNVSGGASQFNTLNGHTVTLSSGQTLHGTGDITAAIINQGTISADVAGKSLDMSIFDLENDHVMQATNQSTLNITGISVANSSGQIAASNQSAVVISSTTITGGTVSATADSYIEWDNGIMSGAITLSGTQNIPTDTTTTMNGSTLTNNGKIIINSDKNVFGTALNFDSDASLDGSGEILLNNAAGAAQLNVINSHTLTIQSGQLVDGEGDISGNIINNGNVTANVAGQILQISANGVNGFSNFASLNASNGATLQLIGQFNNSGNINASANSEVNLTSVAVSNTATGALNIAGSLVLSGATIDGGSVIASAAGAFVQVGLGNSTIQNTSFTLGTGDHLDIDSDYVLTFAGTMALTNNGTISVNADQNVFGTALDFDSDITVGGTGDILLNVSAGASQFNTEDGYTVTLGSGQTLHGTGDVVAAIINQGTISADVAGKSLDMSTTNVENDHVMQATNQSTLNITGMNIANANGLITALNQSTVNINSTTVTGGLVSTSSDSQINWNNDIIGGAITLSGTENIPSNTSSTVNSATLMNNGKIVINSDQNVFGTALNFDADTSLAGAGEILLNNAGGAAQLNVIDTHTLTIGSAELIHGQGDISGNLINNGTISADVAGQSLNLNNFNVENDHILQANNQSILNINSVVVANSAGQIAASNQSAVVISNSTITGGTVSASSNSHIEWDSSILSGSITLSGTQNIPANTTTTIDASTLTNNGKIVINSDQNVFGTALNIDADTSLAGTGEILLNHAGGAAQLNVLDNHLLTIGSGQLIHGQGIISGTLINGGTIRADAAGQSLEITDAITNSGRLDVAGGLLVLDQGVSGTTIISQLHSGFANGAWNGTGIISSRAQASSGTGVGYTNAGVVYTLMYTWIGDANLDGVVDGLDYDAISPSGTTWATGDFNYDGAVNADDYAMFMLGAAIGGKNISTTLPEPSLILASGCWLVIACRRRERLAVA